MGTLTGKGVTIDGSRLRECAAVSPGRRLRPRLDRTIIWVVAKRRDWLRKQLPAFLCEYGRTSRRRGADPNDRHYDRELEQQVKRMDPQELDDLLRSDDE